MLTTARSLALAGSAGFALSLLSALPADAHGLAGSGVISGALHPLTGLDHLLLLVGVGAVAGQVDRRLLLPALLGAVVGAVFGAFGGGLPFAELLAALSVSALGGLLLLAGPQRRTRLAEALGGGIVAGAVAIHALLHGVEATGDPTWWIGASLVAVLVVGLTSVVVSRSGRAFSTGLAIALAVSGVLLAFAPLLA